MSSCRNYFVDTPHYPPLQGFYLCNARILTHPRSLVLALGMSAWPSWNLRHLSSSYRILTKRRLFSSWQRSGAKSFSQMQLTPSALPSIKFLPWESLRFTVLRNHYLVTFWFWPLPVGMARVTRLPVNTGLSLILVICPASHIEPLRDAHLSHISYC